MNPYSATKASLVRITFLLIVLLPPATAFGDCSTIGAIRWDAWFGDKGDAGMAVMKTLGPEKWHGRLPFCAKVIAPDAVQIECDSLAVMNQEIAYAKKAGIDYWAFLADEQNSPMSLSLNNYLSSSNKSNVQFAIITQLFRFWHPKGYSKNIDRFVSLMREPSYQKVAGGRPLFFIMTLDDEWIQRQWGSDSALKAAINDFRRRAENSGSTNPYIVVMDFNPKRAKQLADRFGFDAISSYLARGNARAGTYESLAADVEKYWTISSETGAQVVPIVMSGWDRRPRVENPVPWEVAGHQNDNNALLRYYEKPTMHALGKHLENALTWVDAKSAHSQANTVLIYAWNEFDEGGWLAPTLSEGTARIDEISKVTRRDCPSKY